MKIIWEDFCSNQITFPLRGKATRSSTSRLPNSVRSAISLGLAILISLNWFSVGFAQSTVRPDRKFLPPKPSEPAAEIPVNNAAYKGESNFNEQVVTNSEGASFIPVDATIDNSTTANSPPIVDVGLDQSISISDVALLAGSISDDGLPDPPSAFSVVWSQQSGPGSVAFGNNSENITTASFPSTGTYTLRLTVSDGEFNNHDELTITVNADYPNTIRIPQDFATIQAGIDAAQDGDLVLVSPGTYVENLILNKTITLASTYYTTGDESLIEQTVISSPDITISTIEVASGTRLETKILGFTLTAGADGVKILGKAKVLNNRFINGAKDAVDFSDFAVGLVQDNFMENNGDDGVDIDHASVLIQGNLIQLNNGDGVEIRALNNYGSQLTIIIRNNELIANSDDGIQLIDDDATIVETATLLIVDHNLIENNALAGLGLMDNGITHEDFRAASLLERVHLFNNTFVGNQYGVTGGDNLIAINNIFANTTQIAVKNIDGGSAVAYNQFWNNGTDNLGSNLDISSSLFVDPLLDSNFHLDFDSPAIDAGTAQYALPSGETVLDIPASAYFGSAPDLGAFESNFTTGNQRPTVDAGPDQIISFPNSVSLVGTVTDDGLPDPPASVTTTWSQVSGPGIVTFVDASSVNTTASFSSDGVYVLRLTASDGEVGNSDELIVTVNPVGGVPIIEEVRIAAGTDDAEEDSSGSVSLASSDLELVLESDIQTVGMRFSGLSIPQDANITKAYVQFQADETNSEVTALTIHGEANDNAPTFVNANNNITSRDTTTALVTWEPQPWLTRGEAGPNQQTPDISPIIDEIVTRSGWSEGNSLVIIIAGTGKRVAESFNGDQAGAPLLHIEFTSTSSTLGPVITISSPQDNSTFNDGNEITFSGTAIDNEDGNLTANLQWDSSLDGPIGNGGIFASSNLSVGDHLITASVTDSAGNPGSADISIKVFPYSPVFVGAGDIASCSYIKDEETAKLLDNIPGTIFTLGDNAYEDGLDTEFNDCYEPTWGRHKARTRPAPGNHDFNTPEASGYFNYFGSAAGEAGKGYYSFDIGDWHIISLNSECSDIGGCGAASPQGQWLQADLAANPSACTLAYWHNPLFVSESQHGGDSSMQYFWELLYQANADVVLNGHNHNYERFAPQDPFGVVDMDNGIREFIVGTGGAGHYPIVNAHPNSEVRDSTSHGVLKLSLHPTSYDWEFIPIAGDTFSDSGSTDCVLAAPSDNDPPTLAINTGSTVLEGGTDPIPNFELRYDDAQPASSVTYSITGDTPTNGQLELTSAPGTAISSFTQADIDANLLVYIHDGTNTTSDGFSFDVDDGLGNVIVGQSFAITVTPVDDEAPTLVNNTGSTALEGGTDLIPNSELRYDDTQPASSVTYSVTGGTPTNGQLELTSAPGTAITSFTKADIDAGLLVYIHDGSNTTSDSFNFDVDDGLGNVLSGQSFAITVTPVDDDPPTLVNNTGSTAQEGLSDPIPNIELRYDDAQPPSNVAYTVTGSTPTNGQLELTSAPGTTITSFTQADIDAGLLVYVHDSSNTTSDSFSFDVDDGLGNVLSGQSFAIAVTPIDNEAPTLVNNTGSTVLEGGTDPIPNTELRYDDVQPPSSVTYSVTGGTPTNGQLELTSAPGTATTSFTQADVDANLLVYVHDGTNITSDSFNFDVDDGLGNVLVGQSFSITVTPVDDEVPTLVNNTGSTVLEGGTDPIPNSELRYDDTQPASSVTYSVFGGTPTNGQLELTSAPGTAIISFTQADIDAGLLVYVHEGTNTTSDSFNFDVDDGLGNVLSGQSFAITVTPVDDDPPTLVNNTGSTAQEGLSDPIPNTELRYDDAQPPSNVTYTVTGGTPTNGQLELTSAPGTAITSFTQADIDAGLLVYVHNGSATTSDSFSFDVGDGLGNVLTSQSFAITITTQIPVTSVYVSSTSGGTAGGVSFKDEDILKFDLVTNAWSMFFDGSAVGLGGDIDAFHIDNDGSILLSLTAALTIPDVGSIDDSDIVRFIPTTSGDYSSGTFEWYFDGSDVELEANGEDIDALGFTPNGDLFISTTGAFSVSNLSGKDEDMFVFSDVSLGESTSGTWNMYFDGSDVSLDTNSSEDISGTWSDTNNDIYIATRGTFNVANVSGDGADIFICKPDSTGETTSCTFSVFWDGSANGFSGEITDGISLSISGGGPSNTPPVAGDDQYTTNEDTPLNMASPGILGDDADGDGDSLTANLVSNVNNGSLTLNPDGSFSYSPNPDYNGLDSFTYTANDGQSDSNLATVNITVNAVNDSPTAGDDTYSTNENNLLNVPAPGVLGDDSDVDGDDLTANLVTDVVNGSLTLNTNGSFSYDPDAGYIGDDSFIYLANDGLLDSNLATVTISVNPANDPPIAGDDAYSTDEDTPLNVAAPGVLDDDTDGDGDLLTANLVSDAANGSLTLNLDGSLSYSPNTDYNGPDSFTYTANDGQVDSNIATVNLTVNAVNDAPTAGDDTYSTNENNLLNVPAPGVLGDDSDVEGDSLSANLVTDVNNGSLNLNPDGSFSYDPNPGFIGADNFTYKANDGLVDSNLATVTITVTQSAPVTIEVRVAASTDDAEEGASGSVSLGSSDLELVLESDIQTVGMRFNGVAIPKGANITDAYIQFQADERHSDPTSLTVQGEANDNAPTFVNSTNNITNREKTSNSVAWAPPPWNTRGEAGADQQTPDIASVIQEIIIRSGWSSGNSLVIIITGDGKRVAESYNGDPSGAPLLHVEYFSGVSNTAPVANDDGASTGEDTSLAINVAANDTDPDGNLDISSAAATSNPSSGTVINNGDGSITYSPDPGFNGTDSFNYEICDTGDDGDGGTDADDLCDTATVNINVNPSSQVQGALTQLAGTAGCVSEDGTGGTCNDGSALDGAERTAISPDGKNLYVAMETSNSVAIFSRDLITGALTQLAGTDGCVSENGTGGACADGRALVGARSVAVSPDGKNVYAATNGSSAVVVFSRDLTTGALTQLLGTDGCVSETGTGGACADGTALDGTRFVIVSSDGKNVYAGSYYGNAVVIFSRDETTGAITQLAGTDGCVSETGTGGACADGVALDRTRSIDFSPDGKFVYVASQISEFSDPDSDRGAVSTFSRDLATGALTQLAGTDGCVSESGTGGACTDGIALARAFSVAVSPDGRNVYVGSFRSSAVAVFSRDLTTGVLTQLTGTNGCVSESGTGGACANGTALANPRGVTVSPDGNNVYVAALNSDAVAVFSRDGTTGVLTQLSGLDGCISETGTGGNCADGNALDGVRDVKVSPDGINVYVGSFISSSVSVFMRKE